MTAFHLKYKRLMRKRMSLDFYITILSRLGMKEECHRNDRVCHHKLQPF